MRILFAATLLLAGCTDNQDELSQARGDARRATEKADEATKALASIRAAVANERKADLITGPPFK